MLVCVCVIYVSNLTNISLSVERILASVKLCDFVSYYYALPAIAGTYVCVPNTGSFGIINGARYRALFGT